jgi:ribonuclease BN (tRNA processing enzyme)
LAREAGVKRLGLFHINQERTDDQMDDMVEACRQYIAEQGLKFECIGVASDMKFEL